VKAAVVTELDGRPGLADFPDPVAGEGQVVVNVTAAGVHHLDVGKASKGFYAAPPRLPFVLGSDGVGHLADGRRVFFDEPVAPYGSWAEKALLSQAHLLEPTEGVEDVVAAALGNTGLAAWLALTWRGHLRPGQTVLVLGATGAVGTVAVQAAKVLGAGRVVAADRNAKRLERLRKRGADATVTLASGTDLPAAFRQAARGGVDIIIDPLWGEPALAAMKAAGRGARHVQIGQMAGTHVDLPAAVLRSAGIEVLGFVVFHAPLEVRREAYLRLTEHAARGEISLDVKPSPLAQVATAWKRQQEGPRTKLVLTV
jgi:NADPH:quinone reductase-like Zn-dependent oxidoreductase